MNCSTTHNFAHTLKEHQVRPTSNRLLVMRALHRKERQSADELYSRVRSSMNRVTVFRTLQTLESVGVIVGVHESHGATQYELTDHHTHRIHCVRCGFEEVIPKCSFHEEEKAALMRSKKFARIDTHNVSFQGVCARCATQ